MSINDCIKMTMFLCFICLSISAKKHGFGDECVFALIIKSGGKTIVGEKHQMSPWIVCETKISSKSLYLAPFPR